MEEKDLTKSYLQGRIEVTPEIKERIKAHRNAYPLAGPICAYYADWEEFFDEWCGNLGYSESDAKKIFHSADGEFLRLPGNMGIVRFVI